MLRGYFLVGTMTAWTRGELGGFEPMTLGVSGGTGSVNPLKYALGNHATLSFVQGPINFDIPKQKYHGISTATAFLEHSWNLDLCEALGM